MARNRILDAKIMAKIAEKSGNKDIIAINKKVSRKASNLRISSEAALIIMAKELGIGTSTYQRKLDPTKQTEVRAALLTISSPKPRIANSQVTKNNKKTGIISKRALLKSAIEFLIQDKELKDRCEDILLAPSKFDRPINQATLVLEDRIRKKAQPAQRLVGENLVNYAFKEDLSSTVLRMASNDADDQRGFTQIIRGIIPAFRNKTHHHITNTFSREEAMRVCGFIDVLLRVVDNSMKR